MKGNGATIKGKVRVSKQTRLKEFNIKASGLMTKNKVMARYVF